MRVSVLQENLQKGLSIVSRAIPSKPTLPILSNILMSTDGQRIKLSSTNLELGITMWIGGKVDEEGATTIPGKTFLELVNNLSPERVDLELNPRNLSLNLRCGGNTGNIKCIDYTEYPIVPTASGNEKGAKVDSTVFKEMVRHVDFAAAKDDNRPILTGVLIRLNEDSIIMASADGYRLAVRDANLVETFHSGEDEVRFVVPAKTLSEVAKIISDEDQVVSILIPEGRKQVMFHLNHCDIVSNLIEGNFPDYEAIIPRAYTTTTQMYTSELLRACKRSEVFAKDSANAAKIIVNPPADQGVGRVLVTSKSQEKGDNEGLVDASIEGSQIEISFNIRYLIDVLNVIQEDQIVLETSGAASPGVIRPIGREDFIHVIMPMSVGR